MDEPADVVVEELFVGVGGEECLVFGALGVGVGEVVGDFCAGELNGMLGLRPS